MINYLFYKYRIMAVNWKKNVTSRVTSFVKIAYTLFTLYCLIGQLLFHVEEMFL